MTGRSRSIGKIMYRSTARGASLSPTKASHRMSGGKQAIRAAGIVMLVLSLGACAPLVAPSATAPAAPATPPAASAPAAVAASSAPQPAVRTVASGERQRIGFFYTLNPDCTSGGYTTVRVITPPAHGELTTERGVDYTNYPKEDQRYQCNLKKSPVTDVYYKSNSGYLGTDSTLIEVASPTGITITRIYTITVR